MLKVKTMDSAAFKFATDLANTMNWDMAPEDFQFMIKLEPKGSFVIFDNSKPVGIATTVSYGKVGWFGNLVVQEEYRHRGAGSMIVKHAVQYLLGKGVETVGLYAYPHLKQFYARQGFELETDFSVLHGKLQQMPIKVELPKITKRNIQTVFDFDKKCFGGDRSRLLESIILEKGNISHYISDSEGMVGFIGATVYETAAWIGPLVCRQNNFECAVLLVRSVLADLGGKNIYAVIPKTLSPVYKEFLKFGFKEEFFVSRMFLGKAVANSCICIAESLERG